MSPLDEERYAAAMSGTLKTWRGRAADESRPLRLRTYAGRRADCLARPYVRRLERCGKMGKVIKCACPRWRGVRWYTCRQHLTCSVCCRQRAKRLGARVRAGLEAAYADAPAGHRWVLLTLTVRHSGDVAADRAALARGWRGLYRRLQRRGWGKFAYVGVWEVTAGADGLGHVHAHVAALWPWRDWGVVRELWLDACPDSERITFVARRRDGRPSTAASIGNYLGKYLAKGVQTADFTPQLRADVVAASYQTRWVFTSVRFWQPWVSRCPGCNSPRVEAQYRFGAHGELTEWSDVDNPGCRWRRSRALRSWEQTAWQLGRCSRDD